MKRVTIIVCSVYVFAYVVLVLGLPRSKYEWMLDAAESESPLNFRDLPTDPDGPLRALVFAGLAIMPMLVAGLLQTYRHRALSGVLIVAIILMTGAWVYLIVLTPHN